MVLGDGWLACGNGARARVGLEPRAMTQVQLGTRALIASVAVDYAAATSLEFSAKTAQYGYVLVCGVLRASRLLGFITLSTRRSVEAYTEYTCVREMAQVWICWTPVCQDAKTHGAPVLWRAPRRVRVRVCVDGEGAKTEHCALAGAPVFTRVSSPCLSPAGSQSDLLQFEI